MKTTIAAHRVIQPTFELQAEGITAFSLYAYYIGSLSVSLNNDNLFKVYTPTYVDKGSRSEFDQPYTGKIAIRGNLNTATIFNFDGINQIGAIKFDLSEFAKLPNLEQIGASHGTAYPTGSIASLPKKLKTIFLARGYITGDILDIPKTIEIFLVATNSDIIGL